LAHHTQFILVVDPFKFGHQVVDFVLVSTAVMVQLKFFGTEGTVVVVI
jgi:hypothetical protein